MTFNPTPVARPAGEPCPALVCSCGGAPFTPQTARGLSRETLLAMVGQDAIKRGVARPLPPGPVPVSAAEQMRLCAARMRDGSLCGRHYAMSDGRFCRFHSGQDPFSHAADLLKLSPAEEAAAANRALQARVRKMGGLLRMMGIDPDSLHGDGQ